MKVDVCLSFYLCLFCDVLFVPIFFAVHGNKFWVTRQDEVNLQCSHSSTEAGADVNILRQQTFFHELSSSQISKPTSDMCRILIHLRDQKFRSKIGAKRDQDPDHLQSVMHQLKRRL